MPPEDHSGARPAGPVVLRIKLRYEDIDAMVQRFAPNVGKSGLFLPTKSIQPVGTEVKFELRLANDVPALVGIGRVKHVKPPDPTKPKAAFGMAIELMRVSREGREVIIRMIERRRAMGLADVAIPLPEDAESARRAEVETQPRADTGGIVGEAMQSVISMPVADALLPNAQVTGPIAVAKPLTSPRESGPIKSVAGLAPEPQRAKRPRVADLIARAAELSGPLAAAPVPGLDENVDVDAVLARARLLAAGSDLEAELANLREAAAAPIEISIDAASAELARQLGGVAIAKRDRSARWAPPPAIETKPSPPPPEAVEQVIAAAIDRAVESTPSPDPARATIEEPQHVEHVVGTRPLLIDDDADASSFEQAYADGERLNTGDLEALDAGDGDERGERTVIGSNPIDLHIADQVDRQLDEAEAEANADVSQGFQDEYPNAREDYAGEDQEVSDGDVLAEADEQDADLLERAPPVHEIGPADSLAEEFDRESAREFDREIRASSQHAVVPDPGDFGAAPPELFTERPSVSDFAARLDLGDDDELPDDPVAPPPVYQRARRASSASEFPDPPSSSYTFAEPFPDAGLPPHASTLDRVLEEAEQDEFDAPHAYGRPQQAPAEQDASTARQTHEDLEHALSALDVDDINVERAQPRSTPTGQARPLPGLPIHRPTTGPVPVVPKQPTEPVAVAKAPTEHTPAPQVRGIAHTVKRQPSRPSQPPASQPSRPSPSQPSRPSPSTTRPPPSTTQPPPTRTQPPSRPSHPTRPPPPPAAAYRKTPTQQVPVTPAAKPAKRASTDEGVLIDFDDDE